MSLKCEIFVERQTTNQLNPDKLQNQYQEIVHCLKNRPSAGNTKARATPVNTITCEGGGYRYGFVVTLTIEVKRSETSAIKMLEKAKLILIRAATNRSWTAKDLAESKEAAQVAQERGPLVVGELSKEILHKYFGDVYEREAHLRIIHAATECFVETKYEERNHTLLVGPAASAKTILFEKLKALYESKEDDVERVAIINSVTLSKAGIETWLLEKARDGVIPEIICFDEIEKFDMSNLSALLSIMDGRGQISRLNAKIGRVVADAKVLIWATANSLQKVKDFNDGALYSRFTYKLNCQRPTKELMKKILYTRIQHRLNKGYAADFRWADVALEYGFEKAKTDDPRTIIGYLAGKDRLLSGDFFKDLEQTLQV